MLLTINMFIISNKLSKFSNLCLYFLPKIHLFTTLGFLNGAEQTRQGIQSGVFCQFFNLNF